MRAARSGRRAQRAVVVIGILAIGEAAPAQNLAWTAVGDRYDEGLGWDVAICGDVDGDGLSDLLVGDRPDWGEFGTAFVYSSASPHAQLLAFTGDAIDDHFGNQVGDLGDVDGDGLRDFAISAPDRVVAGAPVGAIFVESGTGALLRTITSPNGTQLGLSMAVVGDLDGDGIRDLVYNDDFSHYTVVVESGATGAAIRTHTSSMLDFGYAVGRVGDADADGIDDYAICDHDYIGHVRVYSGATGAELFAYVAYHPTWVKPGGDADGDGHADLLFTTVGTGVVLLVSGQSGAMLQFFTWNGESDFGRAASTFGDYDGDGKDDVVISRNIDPYDPWDIGSTHIVFSGVSGKELDRYFAGVGVWSLDGSADADGDGVHDVLTGSWIQRGAWSLLSGATGTYDVRSGVTFAALLGECLAVIGDRDGDGWRDVAMTAPGGLDVATSTLGAVEIVSGQDGHELSRFGVATNMTISWSGVRKLVPAGDLDGDGLDDLAVACPGGVPGSSPDSRAIELHSGADDSLLGTIVTPIGLATGLASAAELDGTPLLAVSTHVRTVYVYDLTTSAIVTQINGFGGGEVACMGDVDHDGLVDWLVEDPVTTSFGVFTGGAAPTKVWSKVDSDAWLVDSVRDLDGDGIDDVLVGEPAPVPSRLGRVLVLSGVDGTKLYEVADTAKYTLFGNAVASVGDLDRDGAGDFAVGAPSDAGHLEIGAICLYSGRTGASLYRFVGAAMWDYLGKSLAANRWHEERSLDPDRIPDLVSGASWFDQRAGRGIAFRLDDLLLQITPPSAAAATTVTLSTRDGPTGNLAGLFAVDFSGTPLNFFFAFGTFDSLGEWSLAGTVPPGVSGNTLSLRSYAIGFRGKVVDSQTMTLTFL